MFVLEKDFTPPVKNPDFAKSEPQTFPKEFKTQNCLSLNNCLRETEPDYEKQLEEEQAGFKNRDHHLASDHRGREGWRAS